MSVDAENEPADHPLLDRVRVPGTLLMGVGFANLLGGLLLLQTGIQASKKTPAEFREGQREAIEWMKELGFTVDGAGRPEMDVAAEDLQHLNVRLCIGWAVLTFFGAFITTYGGYNLRNLNSYKMALCGALMAAIPCTSPSSICGLGLVVGIWCLIVLMNREVRSAFP